MCLGERFLCICHIVSLKMSSQFPEYDAPFPICEYKDSTSALAEVLGSCFQMSLPPPAFPKAAIKGFFTARKTFNIQQVKETHGQLQNFSLC